MTRPARSKLLYFAAMVAVVGLVGWLIARWYERPLLLLLVGAVFLVPGRLQAWWLRDHFQGRRAHRAGRLQEAIAAYERQLADVEARPWKNHVVWLGWMLYTTRTDAMVCNNLAAVEVDRGEAEAARRAANRALELDPVYPLPWVNLATVALLEGDRHRAEACLQRAEELGFSGTDLDRLLMSVSAKWGDIQAATVPSSTVPSSGDLD